MFSYNEILEAPTAATNVEVSDAKKTPEVVTPEVAEVAEANLATLDNKVEAPREPVPKNIQELIR
jgi:hypothetical protein